ncbi:NorD nitric oxide reductase activation protein, partial [Cribrihabitans sp. XS_ASV171]
MLHVLDLMEPEETVGNLWHDMASRWGAAEGDAARAVSFEQVRPSLAALFRALGGAAGVEIIPVPLTTSDHRTDRLRRIGTPREKLHIADFDGDRLRLPPVIDQFPTREQNRACYLWLAALAAFVEFPNRHADPLAADRAEIAAISLASDRAFAACPGLRRAYESLCRHVRGTRQRTGLPRCEAGVERLVLDQLSGISEAEECLSCPAPRGYRSYAPVPIWLRLRPRADAGKPAPEEAEAPGQSHGVPTRKDAKREAREQANRRDSFIIHRFESIMSWAESLNLNRMVDDDDQENAAKAAEDQDHL